MLINPDAEFSTGGIHYITSIPHHDIFKVVDEMASRDEVTIRYNSRKMRFFVLTASGLHAAQNACKGIA